MAGNLELYSKAQVYIDGQLLAEEASVSVKRTTAAQVVKTVAKGFAGVSQGAAMIEVSVENAVPSTDFELNPQKYMTNLDVAELTIYAADSTLTSKGFILSDNFSHAVDTQSKLSFEFTGQYAEWD